MAVSRRGIVYVSNRGGRRAGTGDTVAPSSGSQVVTDPRTGSSVSGTITVVDAQTLAVREVEVGLAPSGLALSPDEKTLAVANGHSDTISLIETDSLRRTDLKIPSYPEGTLGSQPVAVQFTPDGKTLYVACGGTNALAVVRTGKWTVLGAMPTARFPSAIAIDRDGSVRVINIKGVNNTADGNGTFNAKQYEGILEKIPALAPAQIAAGTREVKAANSPRFEPAGGISNLPGLGIQHVFLIIKENRTYDEMFGDLPRGNGDPKLVLYGRDITPNHHALAEEFVLLDNFYTSGAISFDGHHWLMQAFVSDYVERSFAAWPRGFAYNMADALTVAPTGFFWQSATKPLEVRIYGETCLPARWDPQRDVVTDIDAKSLLTWSEYWRLYKEGKWQDAVGCTPGVPAIGSLLSRRYPHNSTRIPDQIRAEEFLRELGEREKSGEMPQRDGDGPQRRPHQRHQPASANTERHGGRQRSGAGPNRGGYLEKPLLAEEPDSGRGGRRAGRARSRGRPSHRSAGDRPERSPPCRRFESLQPDEHGAHDSGYLPDPGANPRPAKRARHDQHLHPAGGSEAVSLS